MSSRGSKKKELGAAKRLKLINEISEKAMGEFSLFGEDLAYLFYAIADGRFCEWDNDREIVRFLHDNFSGMHAVWRHVKTTEPEFL